MGRWTWRAHDLKTGTAAADLRLASWQHEDRLCDAGQWTATLEPRDSLLTRQAIDATLPARSTIVPYRNGLALGYEGVVWAQDIPTVSGASLLSYWDRQTFDSDITANGVDQHYLLAFLVDWVQDNGGDIGVDTSQVPASSVLRDQTWHPWEHKNVGEAFRQKADNIGGYDFDFNVTLDEGALVRRLEMWTPRRGRPFIAQSSPVFTVGRNVYRVPSAPANGNDMVTVVVALGEETNATTKERLTATSTRTDLLALGYPRLTHLLDRSDIKNLTPLQQQADGHAYYYGAAAVDEIVLDVNPNDVTWPWGSWDLGDDCLVKIPAGVDPWWPTGFEQIRRIVAHRWNVDADGERLEVVTGRPLT